MRFDLPLSLPQGSVRAILAIGLTGAAIAASFVEALPAEWLYPVAAMVNAFYFGSRPKSEGTDERS